MIKQSVKCNVQLQKEVNLTSLLADFKNRDTQNQLIRTCGRYETSLLNYLVEQGIKEIERTHQETIVIPEGTLIMTEL